jgi:hypothetical protein
VLVQHVQIVTCVFFKFGVYVGGELSIVNALDRLPITDQLFKSYAFTRVVRSQSTLQRLLRRQIKKKKHPLCSPKILVTLLLLLSAFVSF